MPADALLLAGTCIVDEAVLTGESTPQWKAAVGTPEELTAQGEGLEHRLSIKRDKNHVLFSGTKLLQHTGDKEAHIKTPDGACLALVLRTGFETSQGILRSRNTEHLTSFCMAFKQQQSLCVYSHLVSRFQALLSISLRFAWHLNNSNLVVCVTVLILAMLSRRCSSDCLPFDLLLYACLLARPWHQAASGSIRRLPV